MKKDFKTFLTLFTSSFYISMFIIGGGYVALPLLKKRFVEQLRWIEEDEMTDLVAIAQSAPGAVAVNSSLLVGYKVAGFWGAICTVFGTVLPPLILITVIETAYSAFIGNVYVAAMFRGMNAAVAAVMIDIIITMGKDAIKKKGALGAAIAVAVFALVYFLKLNAAVVMLASIALCFVLALAIPKKEAGK